MPMDCLNLEKLLKAKFCRPVDLRSKQSMVAFLGNHPRYHTMNSWNNSTSYAQRQVTWSARRARSCNGPVRHAGHG